MSASARFELIHGEEGWTILEVKVPSGPPLTAEDADGRRMMRVYDALDGVCKALEDWNKGST